MPFTQGWLTMAVCGLLALAATCLLAVVNARANPMDRMPRTVLWAWERPEDVSFIDPASTAVAYWAGTLFLSGEHTRFNPRLQPLRLAPGSRVIAVVRIDTDHGPAPGLSASQRHDILNAVLQVAALPEVRALQLDFDAKLSERNFYGALLRELRTALPSDCGLSMTALPSWCLADSWIRDLPVDERVPMLFNLGNDEHAVASALAGHDGRVAACRGSAGVWPDRTAVTGTGFKRIYLFQSRPWSAADVAEGEKLAARWLD